MGLASTRTLAEPVLGQAGRYLLRWVVLFGGTALLVTDAGSAAVALLDVLGLDTRFWFVDVLVSTTVVGALLVLAGGAFRLAAARGLEAA